MWTLQIQVEGFPRLVWAHSVHSSSTLAALWEQPRPLSPRVTLPYPAAAPWPGWTVPGSLHSHRAREGSTKHPDRWAGSARALQLLTDCSAGSGLGFVSALELNSRFALQWTEHCKPWRTGECAEPTWQHMHLSRDTQAFGRPPFVWKKARIWIYFRTLNTCITQLRECSYLSCLRPVQSQT